MGLDIYLYYCPNREEARKKEAACDAFSTKDWKERCGGDAEYEKLSKSKQDALYSAHAKRCAEFNKTLDCDRDGAHKDAKKVELDSTLYPDHYFKIGYFRSSYNAAGIERILSQHEIPGLHEIFEPDQRYEFTPDWKTCLNRVNDSIKKYTDHLLGPTGQFDVMCIIGNTFMPSEMPGSEAEAMKIVAREVANTSPFGDEGYSNRAGHFFLKEGIEAVAFIPGIQRIFREQPCMYVVTRKKKEHVVGNRKITEVVDKLDRGVDRDWYLKALEIVQETIEYVLKQPDPQNYYLHWSS